MNSILELFAVQSRRRPAVTTTATPPRYTGLTAPGRPSTTTGRSPDPEDRAVNDGADPRRRPRSAWPSTARTAAAILAAAGVALLGAACGGSAGSHVVALSSTATRSGSANVPAATAPQDGALALSRCMRAHGVLNFPDPNSSGAFPKISAQQLGVSSTIFQTAQTECRYLLPNGGSGPSQTQVRQILNGMLKFAQCMRSHGVSNWPDPVVDAGGNPEFYLDGRVDQDSPQIQSKIHGCLHWIPAEAISPGNPIACPGANPGGGPGCGGCSCRRRA